MVVRLMAAGLFAATVMAGAHAASAADLSGPYGSRSDSLYDDPRYADIYRAPKPPPLPPYGAPSHREPYFEEPDDYEGPRRHRHSEYLEPMPHPPGFDDYRPRNAHLPPGCLPSFEIRQELIRDGWSDLHDFEVREDFVFITARRPNGSLYRLKVDRCRGDVERAKRIEEEGDSYAWRRRELYPAY